MNKFFIPTEIYFGENTLERLTEIRGSRICIVADPVVSAGELIQPVVRPLRQAGKEKRQTECGR